MKKLNGRRPKRLTKLRIDEVSVCDSGAGRGVQVVLTKRAKKYQFDGAYGLVPVDDADPVDKGDTSLDRALHEIEETKRFAKAHAAVTEVVPMETHVDINKAAAFAVIQKFDDRVGEIAKRHKITRGAALLKVAADPDPEMAASWFAYRNAQQIVGAQYQAAPEPEPVAVSDAFLKLQKRARKLQKRDPKLSEASAFAAAYQDPANRDLVEQDRAFNFAKAAGGSPVDPNDELVEAIMASLGCDRNHAAGIALELRAKRPPQSTLTVTTRDAA